MNKKFPSISELCEGSFLLFNKPLCWTSFDIVGKVRKIIRKANGGNKIKIGHAGTLDPLATGLLILCTGSFTKKITEFQEFEKEYTGNMVLGATTPSYDLETEVTETVDISHLNKYDIIKTSKKFTGKYMQLPPIYSAVKVQGRRAYDYARTGEEVKITPRPVEIKEFEILKINLPEVEFRVVVSKGTYVRSLIRDFGESLNCGAYLSALCRTRIGNFKIENAFNTNEFEEYYSEK